MKRTITILSLVLIGSLVACDNGNHNTDTAKDGQDTVYIATESIDKEDPLAADYTPDTTFTTIEIDGKERKVGLISYTRPKPSPIQPGPARAYINVGFNRINQGQMMLNGNDPIAWKIAPSDLGGLANGADSAIAVLAEENGSMTLIIGRSVNGKLSFKCDALYETFKPIKRVSELSTQPLKDQFEQELFKDPLCNQ